MNASRLLTAMFLTVLSWISLPGCAGPGPRLFPVAPLCVQTLGNEGVIYCYDTSGDGQCDYRQHLNAAGMIEMLRYDTDHDGTLDLDIRVADIPHEERRHLIIIADSVPFAMVRSAWEMGRFRFFHPPSRVISPFPVMTDLCLSDFFGTLPCPGIESSYFNGHELTNGYRTYAGDGNVPWAASVDYRLDPTAHVFVYTKPEQWYKHELRGIQDVFDDNTNPLTVGYVVGTSAEGARIGRNGHLAALITLDRLCQQFLFETRGRVHITLLSDHGHNLMASERIPLREVLTKFGYHVSTSLAAPNDVIVPEFGMVTCAALHTRNPAAVASDLIGVEGVELAVYREDDTLFVLNRDGRARILHRNQQYRYEPLTADPLELASILENLKAQGRIGEDGFIPDEVLASATFDHVYPDVVHRLWRAFDGLVKNTPSVLLSIQDGWHCGSEFMSSLVHMTAAHGSLKASSSTAFVLTTTGGLPPVLRMQQLRQTLQEQGVPLQTSRPAN